MAVRCSRTLLQRGAAGSLRVIQSYTRNSKCDARCCSAPLDLMAFLQELIRQVPVPVIQYVDCQSAVILFRWIPFFPPVGASTFLGVDAATILRCNLVTRVTGRKLRN